MSVYLSWLAVVGRPRQTPVGASAGRSKPLSIGRVGWKIGCLGAAVRRLLSIAIYIYSWSAANDPLQSASRIVFSNCNTKPWLQRMSSRKRSRIVSCHG